MPIWPFRKRRRSGTKDVAKQPLTEKVQAEPSATAATYPSAGPTPPIPIPRRSSKRESWYKRRVSQENKVANTQWAGSEKVPTSSEKENVPPPISRRRSSREDITALPMSRRLESSPHLRPVDGERPAIAYNFGPYSDSRTSVQRDQEMASPTRPRKLQSRRSNYENSTPSRRHSSRKRKDDHLREEEIRAMSAQMPKRPGTYSESPLRRDSKKMRSLGNKESNVTLPPEESIRSTLSGILEQRGWEIGGFDVFNPRPAVRLSGTPQYVTPGSLPTISSSPLSPSPEKRAKEKMPATRDSERKREAIGNQADDLDSTDIRMLMERDARRHEQRKKEQQEKLDRKLRDRGGRNRGDSDRKKREAREAKRSEEARQRAEQERRAGELSTPPAAVHPALRNLSSEQPAELVGLGIGGDQAGPGAVEPTHRYHNTTENTAEQARDPFTDEAAVPMEDPFKDDAAEQAPTPETETLPGLPGSFSPIQTPMEDPVVETAREMRMSQATTPPLSPVRSTIPTSNLSQVVNSRRASEQPPAPPPPISDARRSSDPKSERRAGAWATFFRRGGTNLRRTDDLRSPPSEASFSNTSRESMRDQPLPPHLVDTQAHTRRKSGTPVRTQSKFREDLPEMPISPPDSRLPSPDVTTAAAAAMAARRAGRSPALIETPMDAIMTEDETQIAGRNDTPITPSARSHRMVSMASVDSEGEWFASGAARRQSGQSGLNQRRPEFSGSYEELGGDRDAEYVKQMSTSPDSRRARQSASKLSSPALAGVDPEEESEEEDEQDEARPETPGDPMTVHQSVRRKPTLVHRDPRVKSREGLLTEYSEEAEIAVPTSAGTGRGSRGSMLDFDSDEPEPQMERATSIDYGKRHARQISSGSAKLFDVAPRTPVDVKNDPLPSPALPSSRQ